MSVLSRPRAPIIVSALEMARVWSAGHVIDGSPALGHAVRVALKLDEHVPDAAAELIAAALLHDAPEYAPSEVYLDAVLSARFGPRVVDVVRALEREHRALAEQPVPPVCVGDEWTTYASAADKIVSLASILRRAAMAADRGRYWQERQRFVARIPYFGAFQRTAAPFLPSAMDADLRRLVAAAEAAVGLRRYAGGGRTTSAVWGQAGRG